VGRILVVDDDRTTRHLIALQLRGAGHSVAQAGDGKKALEQARRTPYDLVLLDVWMPGWTGSSCSRSCASCSSRRAS
jgi:two-component system OmpR family response regulator